MKNRSELREIIMKVLYQVFILKSANLDYDLDEIIHEQLEVENDFVITVTNGIINKYSDIIKLANKYLIDWSIDRFNYVDQAIICIGIFELKYTDTPSIVAINEAVELAKKYSDDSVVKIVNALLDNIYHSEENNG